MNHQMHIEVSVDGEVWQQVHPVDCGPIWLDSWPYVRVRSTGV